jgi:hypothetical protein
MNKMNGERANNFGGMVGLENLGFATIIIKTGL